MLHYTDVKRFENCERLFQLTRRDGRRAAGPAFFNLAVSPEESICRKLGIRSHFRGSRGDDTEKTLAAMEAQEWLVHARLEYRGMRVNVPYLHQEEDGWTVYFLSYSPAPSRDLAQGYALTLAVMEKLGIRTAGCHLLRLNMSYVRGKELDDDAVWIVSDQFCSRGGNPSGDLMEEIERQKPDLDDLIDRMERSDRGPLAQARKCRLCNSRVRCPYFEECFPWYQGIPDNSILFLFSSGHKEEMYEEGRRTLKEADPQRMELNRIQYAQMRADEGGGFFIDKAAMREWLREVESVPASFLDFEWDLPLLPPYEGMKPLEPILTQYSLHVLDGAQVTHREYLGEGDCRRDLEEHLLADLPETGRIYAYNAAGAEMIRIQELAEQLPDLSASLRLLNTRMVDLSLPFSLGVIHDLRQRGSYSLKTLSRIIDPESPYEELDVRRGTQAVEVHRQYEREADPMRRVRLGEELKEYCAMDTRELMKLYLWLQKKAAE